MAIELQRVESMHPELSEAERFPTLTPKGKSFFTPCDKGYVMEYRGDIDADQLRQAFSDHFGESVEVQAIHTS